MTCLPRISVVSRSLPPDGGFATSIATGLSARGFQATAFADADAAAMKADIVLLVGQPSSCRMTIRRIEAAGASRPRVAAWLFEPLPPPEMTLPQLRSATRLSAIRTGKRWLRPVMQMLAYPHDRALAVQMQRGLGPLGLRFLIDTASFALRGSDRGWLDHILVSTEQKRRQLQGWGLSSHFLPVGQQAGFGRDLGIARDIDVLFIGSLKNARRHSTLSRLFDDLRARGLAVTQTQGVWGEARTLLVNRAKIVLHLHQYDWDTPWMRWCLAAANGAVVASEPLSVPKPFQPGTDYLEAPVSDLPDAIAQLAKDAARRADMLASCRSAIAAHMTQTASLDRLALSLSGFAERRKTG